MNKPKKFFKGETVPTVLNAFVAKLESMETFDGTKYFGSD